MLDPDGDLQELPSSEEDDDMDASELRGRIQKIRDRGIGIESPEYTSPIGSPRDEDGALRAKGRFLELKRLMQDDRTSRSSKTKRKSKPQSVSGAATSADPETDDFEQIENDEEWEKEGSISPAASYHDDVEELLESFRNERACEREMSMVSTVSHRMESHPKMMEVYQQLRDRDLKILQLESKVLELDRQVIDFQDTLSERDKLLGSKNEAFNCLVNQQQQTLAEKEIELSVTQETMFELEKKFGAAQEQWKSEKDRLNSELKQHVQRLKDLEDTNKLLESARVEQTTRDLGLEEKLSVLKTDRDRLTHENIKIQSLLDETSSEKGQLEQNLQRKTEEFETTISELKTSLDKSTEQMTKMKKQFQIKLKSLKDEIKDNSTQSESQVTIDALQAKIVDLEEQLQKRLTENDSNILKIQTLEEEVIQLRLQTEDNSEMMDLQIQNVELQNQIQELETRLTNTSTVDKDDSELSLKISSLENKIAEFEEEKGSLILAQEELAQLKLDKESAEKEFLERLGEYEKNFAERVDEYEKKMEEYENKTSELTSSLEKSTEQFGKLKRQFQVKLKALKEEKGKDEKQQHETGGVSGGVNEELIAKCSALENRVAELEDEKGNNLWIQEELNQLKLDKEVSEREYAIKMEEYEEKIEGLKDSLEKSYDQISQLEMQTLQKFSGASFQQASPAESETRITALEHQVAELEEEKGSGYLLEEEISKLKSEREALENTFKVKETDYQDQITQISAALAASTHKMTNMKRQFQAKLKQLRAAAKEGGGNESNSPTPTSEVEVQLQATISSLENRVAELEEEKGNLLLQMVDYDEQQARKDVVQESASSSQEETIRLEINLAEKEEELRQVQDQLNEMAAALSQKNIEVEHLMKNCSEMQQSLQQKVDELSSSVSNKEEEVRKVIQDFEEDNRDATDRISQLEQQLGENTILIAQKEGEIQDLTAKLNASESRFDEINALVNQYQGMLDGVRGHDQEELENLKQELALIQEKATLAEQSYESMKSRYTEEIESRMKTISELEEQLTTVSRELSAEKTNESDLQKKIDALNAQIIAYDVEIDDLKSSLASASENFHDVDLQSSVDEKERLYKTMEAQWLQEISDKNSEIERLNWHLTTAENTKSELEANVSVSKEELEIQKLKLMEMTVHAEQLQSELHAVRNHYSNFEVNYNQMYQDFGQKSMELQQLQESMQTHDGELNKQKLIIEDLQSTIHHVQNEKAALAKQLEDKSLEMQQFQESHQQIEVLQGELNKQGFIVQDLQSTILHLQNEKAQLQLQLDQFSTDSESLKIKLTEITNEYIQLRESLESRDSEAQRLRQDATTLQTEYSQSNNELKLKISTLMDQLNECENEISVCTARLKETDDIHSDTTQRLREVTLMLEEKSKLLEEKTKALESVENSLFEKTEESVRFEERIKEIEDKHRAELESNYVKYTNDLDSTYDQLATTANEKVVLQEQLKKCDNELQDFKNQLETTTRQINDYNFEVNESRDRISFLETQINLSAKHFEEAKANESGELLRIVELQKEVEEKHLRIRELEVEMQELQNLRANVSSSSNVQNYFQQPPQQQAEFQFQQEQQPPQSFFQVPLIHQDSQQQQQNFFQTVQQDAPENFFQPQPQAPQNAFTPQQIEPFVEMGGDTMTLKAELEIANKRVYELEVQLAEMQINAEDSTMQSAEISELKASLEILSYQIRGLEEENGKLKLELNTLKNERTQNIQSFLNMESIGFGGTQPQQQTQELPKLPVEEEPMIRAVAYTTTDKDAPIVQDVQQQAADSQQYTKEIKELKVKNGKMIQRFKQLKDKYDAVVKENETLKTKQEFSLTSAFEDEFMSQVKVKDLQLQEQETLLSELRVENQRLVDKVDLLERGTERLTEMKEDQDRSVQELLSQRRGFESEIYGLKWKIEELENICMANSASGANGDHIRDQTSPGEGITTTASISVADANNPYFNVSPGHQAEQENLSLKHENSVLCQEIQALRIDVENHRKSVDELNERNQQLEEEIEKLQELQIEQHDVIEQRIRTPTPNQQLSIPTSGPATFDSAVHSSNSLSLDIVDGGQELSIDGAINNVNIPSDNNRIQSLQLQLKSEQQEKIVLERKIELLQSKIEEIEVSEIKCFEESLMLKTWTRQLELDSLKSQRELERIYSSIQDGDTGNLKVKVLQDEVIRLVDTLHDRDKRCEQLTLEITRLLEERDTLQLKLSNVLRHNVSLHEEANKGKEFPSPTSDIPSYDKEAIQMKLLELEQINYSMGIDLRREREARRLVQEQMFFSSSSRLYPSGSGGNQQQSYGQGRQSLSPGRSSTPTMPSSIPSPLIPPAPHSSPVTPQLQYQPQNTAFASPAPSDNVPTTQQYFQQQSNLQVQEIPTMPIVGSVTQFVPPPPLASPQLAPSPPPSESSNVSPHGVNL